MSKFVDGRLGALPKGCLPKTRVCRKCLKRKFIRYFLKPKGGAFLTCATCRKVPKKTKICSKCKKRRPLRFFRQRPGRPTGQITSRCRDCSSADHNAYHKRRYREDPTYREACRKRREEWWKNAVVTGHPYVEKVRERRKAHARKYSKENRAAHNAYKRERYARDPRFRELIRTYRHNRRARVMKGGGKHTPEEWEALKAKYGYACLDCGKVEPKIKLVRDHVNPIVRGGSNDISNIQPLCRPCNAKKQDDATDFRKY